jgi:hypothetical protein
VDDNNIIKNQLFEQTMGRGRNERPHLIHLNRAGLQIVKHMIFLELQQQIKNLYERQDLSPTEVDCQLYELGLFRQRLETLGY